MKNKTLTLAISIFACLALIGVGFAAWVLTPTVSDTAEGNIKVDTVVDNSLTVEDLKLSNNNFVIAESVTTGKWLSIIEDDSYVEPNLSVTLSFKIKKTTTDEYLTSTDFINITADFDNVTIALISSVKGTFNSETEVNLIKYSKTETTYNNVTNKFEVTFTIAWNGSWAENGPAEYYNAQSETPELRDEAKKNLSALNNLNCTFNVNLTISAK